MTTAPNNIIDEKDALRVVAQMTIGEIVRGISDHGYAIDGTRKQETPATVNDPDAGRKWAAAIEAARFALGVWECSADGDEDAVYSLADKLQCLLSLDAAQGGVR